MATNTAVLIVNLSDEPIGVTSVRKALRMLYREVAEMCEVAKTATGTTVPRVIRLLREVSAKWLRQTAPFSKRGVLTRDGRICAFCGCANAGTVDHIFPRSRGGRWSWKNTVAACGDSNVKKRARIPEEADMPLLYEPWAPSRLQLALLITETAHAV